MKEKLPNVTQIPPVHLQILHHALRLGAVQRSLKSNISAHHSLGLANFYSKRSFRFAPEKQKTKMKHTGCVFCLVASPFGYFPVYGRLIDSCISILTINEILFLLENKGRSPNLT